MSRGSTRMKVHILWKHIHGNTLMKGTCVEQNMHVLTHKNFITESIALHYTNILLVDQHNNTI